MRADNPGLKLSQVKERVFRAWEKSPDNPKNRGAAVVFYYRGDGVRSR